MLVSQEQSSGATRLQTWLGTVSEPEPVAQSVSAEQATRKFWQLPQPANPPGSIQLPPLCWQSVWSAQADAGSGSVTSSSTASSSTSDCSVSVVWASSSPWVSSSSGASASGASASGVVSCGSWMSGVGSSVSGVVSGADLVSSFV